MWCQSGHIWCVPNEFDPSLATELDLPTVRSIWLSSAIVVHNFLLCTYRRGRRVESELGQGRQQLGYHDKAQQSPLSTLPTEGAEGHSRVPKVHPQADLLPASGRLPNGVGHLLNSAIIRMLSNGLAE
jgi:hypothetical protein